MRRLVVTAILLAMIATPGMVRFGGAQAQATCRQACMNDENACLQRTGNKGQCGGKAQTCAAKCR